MVLLDEWRDDTGRRQIMLAVDQAMHEAVLERLIDATSDLGSTLQHLLALAERHPNPGCQHEYVVRLHPAPLLWLSRLVDTKLSVGKLEMKNVFDDEKIDWWMVVRKAVVYHENVVGYPGMQALLTITRFTALALQVRACHFMESGRHLIPGNDHDELASWAKSAVLECAVALMAAFRLSVPVNDERDRSAEPEPSCRLPLGTFLHVARSTHNFPCVHLGWRAEGAGAVTERELMSACLADVNEIQANVDDWVDIIQRTAATAHGATVVMTKTGRWQNTRGHVVTVQVEKLDTEGLRPVKITIYEAAMGGHADSLGQADKVRSQALKGMREFNSRSRAALRSVHLEITELDFVYMEMKAAANTLIPTVPLVGLGVFHHWGAEATRRFLTDVVMDTMPDFDA